jgi:hypothetical protein
MIDVRVHGEEGDPPNNIGITVTDARGERLYRANPQHGWFDEAADLLGELFPGSRVTIGLRGAS